jgi:hypothetical protein
LWSPRCRRTRCADRATTRVAPAADVARIEAKSGIALSIWLCLSRVSLTLNPGYSLLAANQRVSDAVATSCSGFAGVIATDSPHPQAEVWFGLLKTNPDENLSTR